MAIQTSITALPTGASLDRLLNILNQSKTQNSNPALYQTIAALIKQAQQQIEGNQTNIKNIDATIVAGGAGIQELTGDVTAGPGTGSVVATIPNNTITNAKLRDSSALSVIGRSANSSGDPADISTSAASAAVLRESGSTIGFGTIATGGIANDAITFAKMQNISTQVLIGRNTAGTGDPEEVTISQALDWLGT